jgi:type I restriction-modification system DNA methylase subunit
LTLLYRLLFLLYAESLALVPVEDPAYAEISLNRLTKEIAANAGRDLDAAEKNLKKEYTRSSVDLYGRLQKLFTAIDAGSQEHNLPTYNGGLFRTDPGADDSTREAAAARFLLRHAVPDFYLARALDLLARDEDDKVHDTLVFVDYKSLGVRQLGSIYEGLLMYHVVVPRDDWERSFRREGLKVALVPSNKERKSTGSYFTPQHIVKYIVEHTVGPMLDAKFATSLDRLRTAQKAHHDRRKFEYAKADKLGRPRPTDEQITQWVLDDYEGLAWDLLDVKVLDPAMGSGHFLVETVDYVTDRLLDYLAGFPWNPVQALVDRRIRRQILDALDTQGVTVDKARLTDVNLIKRLVMKRCVYGVDLNPMAVELAKVSLWLDSFTLGAPLSFLDHHLKCGNSLIGATIEDLKQATQERFTKQDKSRRMFAIPMGPLEAATAGMEKIAHLADADPAEVARSASTHKEVLGAIAGYRTLLDCLVAEHFGVAGSQGLITEAHELIDGISGRLQEEELTAKDRKTIAAAKEISKHRAFLHSDVDFPDVFFTPSRPPEQRAFDAVVGNPPWGGLRTLGELGSWLAPRLAAAKKGTDYFALFIEMEMGLLRREGHLGAVLPSGWQTADESSTFRRMLEARGSLRHFVSLPYDTFEDANVDACLLVMSREPFGHQPARMLTYDIRETVSRIEDSDRRWQHINTQVWWTIDPSDHQWLTFMDDEELKLTAKLRQASTRLDAIADSIERGISPYEPVTKPRGGKYELCLDGELRRWTYDFSGEFCTEYHEELAEFKPRELFEGPRTLLRQLISRQFRLQAVPTEAFFLVNQSHQIVHAGEPLSHLQLASILNSAVMAFWHIRRSALARRDDFPKVVLEDTKGFPIPKLVLSETDDAKGLGSFAGEMMVLDRQRKSFLAGFLGKLSQKVGSDDIGRWTGYGSIKDLDYLGWDARYPGWRPDSAIAADGRWYPDGVAPPLSGEGPGGLPWDLIARVYPSYPLPGIDAESWEAGAWEEFCELLRKNKSRIGNARMRAELTGSGAVTHATGPLRQLRETFLDCHRQVRANRARAAELDLLIDRIVFRLFELTADEQRLILSRVGPGRPLPPRRRRGKKAVRRNEGPGLFD